MSLVELTECPYYMRNRNLSSFRNYILVFMGGLCVFMFLCVHVHVCVCLCDVVLRFMGVSETGTDRLQTWTLKPMTAQRCFIGSANISFKKGIHTEYSLQPFIWKIICHFSMFFFFITVDIRNTMLSPWYSKQTYGITYDTSSLENTSVSERTWYSLSIASHEPVIPHSTEKSHLTGNWVKAVIKIN